MDKNEIPKDILPTLIVGLGGTGFQVIKRLKKLFAKKYDNKNLPIRYLIIDTDLKSFLDDTVENNEKCQLRFNEGVKSTLDWAYSNKDFNWLPKNPPIIPDFFTSTDQGAGLMRPIGRLYLCKNSKLVYDTLTTAKNDLVDLYKILTNDGAVYLENIDRHKVYVVGSLAGGTGCGTFLDVSVMLSKIFNRDNTNIIGMFTLESCYDDKLSSDLDAQNRSKANCYAALKELEFYMSSIKNADDERYKFRYNNIGEIKLEKRLLDICYLIENKNEAGGVLTNIEDIYDLCSLQLFQEVGTKLGSQLRADYANFICKDKDPILNRDRHFSTFSSSSMEIPVDNIKRYSHNRLALDILENLTKDLEISEEEIMYSAQELRNNIESEINFNEYTINTESFKLTANTIEALEKSLGNISNAESVEKQIREDWKINKDKIIEKTERVIKEYVNRYLIQFGLNHIKSILQTTVKKIKDQVNETRNDGNSGDSNGVITTVKTKIAEAGKIKKSKQEQVKKILTEAKNTGNSYIQAVEDTSRHFILDELSKIIDNIIEKEITNIKSVNANIYTNKKDISNSLEKINNQANKTYGGNIISREMVSEDYYSKFYEDNYKKVLSEQIIGMISKKNIDKAFRNSKEKPKTQDLLSILSENVKYLLHLCKEKVEEDNFINNLTIIDIMRKNASVQNKTIESYVKEELEITAKLAKPFWSAVKNPEVSWTECYYIGSVKDDNITNGFTIKPHEEIDNWIRSQTGERSRQARYVETNNSNSIDVIHITMGACAGYLPDVKQYKQFYYKLLSEQTYPLHLNESYIGLDDLDKEAENLFKIYTLAQAYGAILIVHGKYVSNLGEDGQSYIYKSKYCLPLESLDLAIDLPENISKIDDEIILGNTPKQVIEKLNDNKQLAENINKFIIAIEGKYSKEELIAHKKIYIAQYNDFIGNKNVDINTREQGDFIAYEKLKYQNSFKK